MLNACIHVYVHLSKVSKDGIFLIGQLLRLPQKLETWQLEKKKQSET